jgi:hypothetical protein
MEFAIGDTVKGDERRVGPDPAESDYVSRWIRMLAIGMMVLGAVFAVLDGCELLPLPAPVAVAGPA